MLSKIAVRSDVLRPTGMPTTDEDALLCDGEAGGALSDFKSGFSVLPSASHGHTTAGQHFLHMTAGRTPEEVRPKFSVSVSTCPGGTFGPA